MANCRHGVDRLTVDCNMCDIRDVLSMLPRDEQLMAIDPMTPPDMLAKFELNLLRVPDHLREGLLEYVRQGRPVGSCLEAIISGDLFDALQRADPATLVAIPVIAQVLVWFSPARCYGSRDRYQAWVLEGGRRRAEVRNG